MPKQSRRLTEEDLKTIVQVHLNNSIGMGNDEVTQAREKALRYYFIRSILKEDEARSTFRTSDVFDVIQAQMPPLLRIFLGGERVGTFKPYGPEDVAAAEQATDYVEYILTHKHNAFLLFYSAFFDALLCKVGVWKRYWDPTETKVKEDYEGLTQDGLALLLADDSYQLDEMTEKEDGISVAGWRVERGGHLAIEVVPPEDFFISEAATSFMLDDAPFVAHRIKTTISDLREMGFDFDPSEVGSTESPGPVQLARRPEIMSASDYGSQYIDESMRPVIVYDCYLKVDWDGDGIAERRQVLKAGEKILVNQEVDEVPFSMICPFPVPHQPIGVGMGDIMGAIQELHTSLVRQILDNHYQMNLGRWAVVDGKVNLNDLLEPTIPQIIRCTGDTSVVRPLPAEAVAPGALNLLEYVQTMKENRSGVTRYNQGLDAQSLNKTATGISAILQQSSQRLEMIARCFAETGVSDLYKAVLRLTCQHQKRKEVVRLRGQWVEVDPSQWRYQRDFIVNVGLGITNRESDIARIMNLFQTQLTLLKLPPPFNALVSPENIYATIAKLVAALGYKNIDEFITSADQAQQNQLIQQILSMSQGGEASNVVPLLKGGEHGDGTAAESSGLQGITGQPDIFRTPGGLGSPGI